jgi:hypothetical protein
MVNKSHTFSRLPPSEARAQLKRARNTRHCSAAGHVTLTRAATVSQQAVLAAHLNSATTQRSIAQPAAEGADTRAQQPEVFALVARYKGAWPRDARAPLEAATTYANS